MSRFLTVQEVADQMRCEHRTVRRAIKRGELEAALIGGRWLVREVRWRRGSSRAPAVRWSLFRSRAGAGVGFLPRASIMRVALRA